jgi:uncharacterized protein involved in cysteine biosynthesis
MDALHGILLTLRTPRLWPLCVAPIAAASVLYLVLGWLGWHFYGARLEEISRLFAFLAYLVLFPFVFYLLSSAFLGLVFDPLSRAVDDCPQPTPPPFGTTLKDTLLRLLLNTTLGLIAFGLGFAVGPFAGVAAAALIGLLDYTSPAFLRRGKTLGPQARQLFTKPDLPVLSFGIVAGLLSLIPVVGLLLAPGLIVGGTLLARRRLQ